jgi:flagellar protein FliL
MLKKLFPVVLGLAGLGGGLAAGLYLRPAQNQAAEGADAHAAAPESEAAEPAESGHEGEEGPEYVKLNNQFVVPVVAKGRVAAMVVLSLSIEVTTGGTEAVYEREPKLRDAFLQVLFDHANTGGFSGTFTDGANLVVLRGSLKEAAALVLGSLVKDVLITDIARQDS